MSVDKALMDMIRGIIREENEQLVNTLVPLLSQEAPPPVKDEEPPKEEKPKRKRKTKAEKEAEYDMTKAKVEAVADEAAGDDVDDELDEEPEQVAVMEAHDLLREVKAAVATSAKDNPKDVAKKAREEMGYDKFTDVPEDKRAECLKKIQDALA